MNAKPKSNKMKKLALQEKARMKELADRKQKAAEAAQQRQIFVMPKKKIRNLKEVIIKIHSGEVEKYDFNSPEISIKNAFLEAKTIEHKNFLRELLLHLDSYRVDFLRNASLRDSNLAAIIRLASFHEKAIRPIENWKPCSYNTERCVASLMRHLYAKYEVPHFMDKVWYKDRNLTEQNWFIHIGHGQNIRTAENLPITLTKRQAHFFLKAPRDFEPSAAFRYGQIIDMGGNDYFVRQILTTRVNVDFTNDEFWFSVFRWLMKNPMFDAAQYAPLIDYIFNQKFVPTRIDEKGNMVAEQPNFSIKERDPGTLLRQMMNWHTAIGKRRIGAKSWKASGIPGLFHETGKNENKTVYVVKELCTETDLINEGKDMHHCVGSYAWSCARGDKSIWSLEELNNMGKRKVLTIEVRNADKTIIQARGKYNKMATASDMSIVHLWSRKAGLRISGWMA